jgi:D-lactate dehydrogenase
MTEAGATPVLASLARILASDELLTDAADCWAYGYDNSRRQGRPAGVALPSTPDQAAAVIAACSAAAIPLTVRGRGTGTAGAAVPDDGSIVLSTERLDRIIAIDGPNRVAVVQPGVTNAALQRAAGEAGFFWPPDPTSAEYCTIGGNLGCNSAGPRAVKYGTPRDNTLGLTVATGTGQIIRTGCYTTKGVVGYDLTRLLIGAEGTLGVILEATLKLTPLPEAITTLRAVFADMESAALAVSRIMSQAATPRVLEFMDGKAAALAAKQRPGVLPEGAGSVLLIEADGTRATVGETAAAIGRAARGPGLVELRTAENDDEARQLWEARKALSPALRGVAPGKINEDVVVPVAAMGTFIAQLEDIGRRHDVLIVSFGHAGNGNIHVNLLGDTEDTEERARMERCLADVFSAVLAHRGTLSGEHGIGLAKRDYVGLELSPEVMGLMRGIKTVFDPAGILNPGKGLPETT